MSDEVKRYEKEKVSLHPKLERDGRLVSSKEQYHERLVSVAVYCSVT
jgi:hypothetical protein